VETYFSTYEGYYFTGDGARRDEEGYFWITGRVDDVLNISGHRLGTAEVESALVEHELVAEAAVVGFPHPVKGQGIYAYVTLMQGYSGEQTIIEELKALVTEKIGPIAKPDLIQWSPNLPKTRSGKIMRRILRKIADFGAFVNILPGKDGLVHISQIAEERVEKVTDYLSEGQEVKVKVLDVDRGRIKLSMKDFSDEDADAPANPEDDEQ
jgi:acetyl-CoA synthetase